MDMGLLERVLDKVASENPKAEVFLYGNSEPFLHSNLPGCVLAVKRRGLVCNLSSNLNFIRNDSQLSEVLAAGPDELTVSVSGFTQEIYSRAHRGGNIETVKANMRKLADAKRAVQSGTRILVHYHLYRDNWGGEMEAMKTFVHELGFVFITSWARVISMEAAIRCVMESAAGPGRECAQPGEAARDDAPTIQLQPLSDAFYAAKARLCFGPEQAAAELYQRWETSRVCPVGDLFTFIRSDGSVSLCCAIADRRLKVGNFLETTQEQMAERRRGHPLCAECLKNKLYAYFHIADMDGWTRMLQRTMPDVPASIAKA